MTTINLGPGMTIQYVCRNMTMAAFADGTARDDRRVPGHQTRIG